MYRASQAAIQQEVSNSGEGQTNLQSDIAAARLVLHEWIDVRTFSIRV